MTESVKNELQEILWAIQYFKDNVKTLQDVEKQIKDGTMKRDIERMQRALDKLESLGVAEVF